MAKNYLDTFVLPNSSTYYFRDNEAIGSITRTGDSLIVANRVGTQTIIPNTDFDTINVTELNAGNLIVTGAARFLNPINGNITGQAGSVANSLTIQLNSGTTEGTNKFTYNGSSAKTVNITKSGIGLSNVENKSSATIRGEITSSNVTTALGYTPLNKAGDTITGPLKFGDQAIPQFSGSPSYILGIEAFASGGDVKWQNVSIIKVGSATKDGNGNVIADYYVKKSGDTMSGLLTTQARITTNASLVLQKPDDVEWSLNGNNGEPAVEMNGAGDNAFKFKFTQYGTNVDVGWDWAAVAGSGAFFRQADSPSSPGYFGFFARNSSGTSQLMGSPSGVLTWANRRVVTSTNNTAVGTATQPVYVDANGYIVAGTALQGGAYKAVSTTVTQNDENLITSGAVYTAIENLPEPMVFKGTLGTGGTITTLPTASASNEGFTYKVITAGTYASQSAKVGDLFVCAETSSGVYSWVIIPAGDTDSDTWRNIKVDGAEKLSTAISSGFVDFISGNHISLSFNATGNKLTVAHADTSSQASVSNSGRTYIQSITLDGDGHVTKLTSATETVTDTNYYHKTGTWSGLTYTATKVGSPDDLAFTIPTGTTATTVALGNHNHDSVYLKLSGGTMTGQLHFTSSAPLVYDWVHTTESPMIILKDSPNYGIRYQEGNVDTMKFSASGNANTNNADLCINGAGDGTVTIRGNTIIHAGNYTNYTVKKDGTGASGTWGISVSGNAGTATKLSTARTISLGSDLVGSASFDGSGDITINANSYYCGCNGGNKANYPWHRFAVRTGAAGTYTDTNAVFDIMSRYNGGGYGRIKISLRTNNTDANVNVSATWMYRYNLSEDCVKIASWGVSGQQVYADVFIQCGTWPRRTIYEVEGSRNWLLVDSSEKDNTTPEDKNGSIEVYASIESAATELHGQAYTQIVSAVDGSVVGSSRKLLTARNIFNRPFDGSEDVVGQPTVYGSYNATPGSRFTTSGIQIRENGLVTNTQSDIAYAPSIGFHWSNRIAATLLLHSDGIFYFRKQNFTDRATIDADVNGNATSATKATQDESGNNIKATYMSSLSVASNVATFKNKNGTSLGTITASTASYGSASAGTAISADDITSWSAGTLPTLGTAISADDITAWDAGSTPTLGTAISADDITAWSAGTMFSASFDGKCTLTLTSGSVPTLSYTGRSIPNVTSVGSVPSLSYTARSIPNVTGVGTLPDLKYTARSIPNISVSSKTVVTGIS